MVNVITFMRVYFFFVVFSFFLFISLYSCGTAKEVSEGSENQSNLYESSYLSQQKDSNVEPTYTPLLKDTNVDLGDAEGNLSNRGSGVLQLKPFTDSNSEVDPMAECIDYDLYYQIYVERVLSDHVVTGFCGKTPVTIQYAGITSLENKSEMFEKAVALNNFLVSNKQVFLRIYEKRFDREVIHVLGEIFIEGESVTVRLISTGLVKVSPSDAVPDRINVFLEISEKSKTYHGGGFKSNGNETDTKESMPSIGCGTLPCQP